MQISLSDHFTLKRIFKFVISPIFMMIFISLYGIVDGYFISNFAGLNEYAGVNVIMPVIMIIGGIGFMFGTGGSALVGKYLGQRRNDHANAVFTMIIKAVIIVGIAISIGGFFLVEPIAEALGKISTDTTREMVDEAIKYGRTLACGQVFFMLQNVFQSFMVVDEKPKMGFYVTIAAGVTNMILDALFIAVLGWGVIGAAIATIMGYVMGSIIPLIHFLTHKDGNISFVKTKIKLKEIGFACFNGSSEFVSNISSSIVGIVFNIQLLRYFGQNGVAAYGTLMYICFIFVAIFIGYSIGMAPVVAYNFGSENYDELKNVLSKSLLIILVVSVCMFAASELVGPLFAKLYVGDDVEIYALTKLAFKIFSIEFLFCGFSIYLSGFFTALNNGLISALISFLRTLVFQISFVFIFPLFMGSNGIWWSITGSEIVAFILSFIFLFACEKKYHYFKGSKFKNQNIDIE